MSISRKLRHRSEQLFDRRGKTRTDSYAYNTRNELTGASLGVNPYSYDYDNIGNRKTAQEIAQESTYTANTLNQYSAITRNQVPFTPTFDPDGNQTLVQTSTGIWKVTYNADSRPVRFTQQGGTTTIDCGYDYMGRRYEKKITVNGTITLHQHYLYRGYLQIAALDKKRTHLPALWYTHWDPTEPTATRPLSIRKSGIWYTYGCDLTKNVQELFAATGAIATTYDYTPFGAVTRQGAFDQPFQWSSEAYDDELALTYYNYRHYNPMDGRWINRDPIAEQGGYNLYGFVGNGAMINVDWLGFSECKKPSKQCMIDNQAAILMFDGMTLSGPNINIPAVSGNPNKSTTQKCLPGQGWLSDDTFTVEKYIFDYSKSKQGSKDSGPTPEGEWWFSSCSLNDSSNANRHLEFNILSLESWGKNSWHIRPGDSTDAKGRDNIFLHGGCTPGSKGCIDAFGGGEVKVKEWVEKALKEQKCCYVTIKVEYKYSSVVVERKSAIINNGLSVESCSSGWVVNGNL